MKHSINRMKAIMIHATPSKVFAYMENIGTT